MPETDDRIRDALQSTAREPSTDGVVERVRVKRHRRRTVRRVQAGLLAAAVLAVAALVSANVLGDDDHRPEIAVSPTPGAGPVVRVATGLDLEGDGEPADVRAVRIDPDKGFVRGPLLASGDVLTFAAYNRAGDSWDYPPSRIIRVRSDGAIVDEVDLHGRIDSLAEGEGARWALTHDKTVIGPEDFEFRVKRIGPDGTPVSNPIPAGEQPVGGIVAGGGGVWVPVRDGVLRFDPATGAFASKIALSTVTDRRAVSAAGKFVYATDGLDLVRLDPATATATPFMHIQADGVTEVTDATNANDFVQLGRSSDGSRWSILYAGTSLPLPTGVEPKSLSTNTGITWFDASAGRRYVLRLDVGNEVTIARTLRISGTGDDRDVMVAFIAPRTMFLTSNGHLYRVRLPK